MSDPTPDPTTAPGEDAWCGPHRKKKRGPLPIYLGNLESRPEKGEESRKLAASLAPSPPQATISSL